MALDRLRETALGRLGAQLAHGLGPYRGPSVAPALKAPTLTAVRHGWRVRWGSATTGGRLFLAVRLLDKEGRPRLTDGPFTDSQGHYLWCQPVQGSSQFIPWLGVPAGVSTAELTVYALGRGPARAVGRIEAKLPAAPGEPWDPHTWAEPMLALAVAVVHADGVIRSGERTALQAFLQDQGLPSRFDLDRFLDRSTPHDLRPACRQSTARLAGWGPRTLLEKLVRLAVASGAPGHAERAVLAEIATHLGAPEGAVERLLEGWSVADDPVVEDLEAAREVLGVSETATRAEVKKAWRDLVRANHPDRADCDDPRARENATRRTARFNSAYRTLMDHGCTVQVAPARQAQPQTDLPTDPPPSRRGRLWSLSSFQVGMGFAALALLALALGLALNDHVEVALVALARN